MMINCLEIDQFEILFDRDQARDALEKANQLLAETKATEARHQQTIQDIRSAYDLTLKHERGRVESLQGEVADFQNKVGMAMRDSQRSQEQAFEAREKVKALEQQLAKQEKAPADQEASKLQVKETKLEQCTAKVLEQETEI
jgi:polyhydroxyalkanoate synthesis regulator phasin